MNKSCICRSSVLHHVQPVPVPFIRSYVPFIVGPVNIRHVHPVQQFPLLFILRTAQWGPWVNLGPDNVPEYLLWRRWLKSGSPSPGGCATVTDFVTIARHYFFFTHLKSKKEKRRSPFALKLFIESRSKNKKIDCYCRDPYIYNMNWIVLYLKYNNTFSVSIIYSTTEFRKFTEGTGNRDSIQLILLMCTDNMPQSNDSLKWHGTHNGRSYP